MFKKTLFITLVSASVAVSATLPELINNAISNNKDLKSLETAIEVADEQIKISKNWKNPVLSLGRNDIRMDEPNKRDLEPMQADFIGFSQIIPLGNKLEIQELIAKKESAIAQQNLENAKLQLKAKVYEYAYSIKILEKKYELLNKYQSNIQSLEQLSNALYENGKMNQSEVIGVKISYSRMQLQKETLKNLINNLYLKLEEITYTKAHNIDISLYLEQLSLNQDISNHPKIKMTELLSEKFHEQSRFEIANKNSDIKFNIAYFNRDSKYEDYANVSVNIPLSIYGTENVKAAKAKLKSQEVSDKLDNLKQFFMITIQSLQNDMNSSLQTHKIISQNIIPLKEDLQKNIESYNSLDQIKPQSTIQNLNEVINYEIMLLDEVKKYFSAYSKSIYFTQGKHK